MGWQWLVTALGMESKLNGIEMIKFETKEELVEWIEIMHLQNTNGRETPDEMFKLGIEAAIEELTEFNLFYIPIVVGRSEQLHECTHRKGKECIKPSSCSAFGCNKPM